MKRLNARYLHYLDEVSLDLTRYLYSQINWDNRLILLKHRYLYTQIFY